MCNMLGNYKSRKVNLSLYLNEIKKLKNEIKNIKNNYLKKNIFYTQIFNKIDNGFAFEDKKILVAIPSKVSFNNEPRDDYLFYNPLLTIDFIDINNKQCSINIMEILFIGIGYQKLFEYDEKVKIGKIHSIGHIEIPKKQFLVVNTFKGATYLIDETYQLFMKRLTNLEKQYKLNNPVEIKNGDEKICWLQTSNGYEFFGKVRFRQEFNWEDFMYIEKYNNETKKYDQLERRRVKCFGKKYLTPDIHIWDIPENYPNMLKGLYLGSNDMYKDRL